MLRPAIAHPCATAQQPGGKGRMAERQNGGRAERRNGLRIRRVIEAEEAWIMLNGGLEQRSKSKRSGDPAKCSAFISRGAKEQADKGMAFRFPLILTNVPGGSYKLDQLINNEQVRSQPFQLWRLRHNWIFKLIELY